MIGPFKTRHPEVYGLGDAAYVFGGRIAKEIFFVLFWVGEYRATACRHGPLTLTLQK